MLSFIATSWFAFCAVALVTYGFKLFGVMELVKYHFPDFSETVRIDAWATWLIVFNGLFASIGFITTLVMLASGHHL